MVNMLPRVASSMQMLTRLKADRRYGVVTSLTVQYVAWKILGF